MDDESEELSAEWELDWIRRMREIISEDESE
jgi:hypothetical protein